MVEAPPWVTYYHHTRLFFGQLILLYRWMLNCSQASVHLCSMSWHQTGLSRGLESKLLLLVILNILSPLTCQSQPKRVNLPHSLTNIRLKDWHTESSWGLISSKSYNFRPRKFSKGSKDPILVIQSGQCSARVWDPKISPYINGLVLFPRLCLHQQNNGL